MVECVALLHCEPSRIKKKKELLLKQSLYIMGSGGLSAVLLPASPGKGPHAIMFRVPASLSAVVCDVAAGSVGT